MDKRCDNALAISQMIDGELDERSADLLRAHIHHCGDCRRVYDALSAMSSCIGQELAPPPELLAKGVMFRINNRKSGSRRFAFGRFTAIAACVALILIAGSQSGVFNKPLFGFAEKSAARGDGEVLEESALSVSPSQNATAEDGLNSGENKYTLQTVNEDALPQLEGAANSQDADLLPDTASGTVTQFGSEPKPVAEKDSDPFAGILEPEERLTRLSELLPDAGRVELYQGVFVPEGQEGFEDNVLLGEIDPEASFEELAALILPPETIPELDSQPPLYQDEPDYTLFITGLDGDESIELCLLLWLREEDAYVLLKPARELNQAENSEKLDLHRQNEESMTLPLPGVVQALQKLFAPLLPKQ